MNRMAALAHEDRVLAGSRLFFRKWERALLAHEDFEVSNEWRNSIVNELRTCDVSIALLGKSFEASRWATQEVGFMAIARPDVIIAPIAIDGSDRSDSFDIWADLVCCRFAGRITFFSCSRCGDKTCRPGQASTSISGREARVVSGRIRSGGFVRGR